MMAGSNLEMSSSQYTSLVTILFFHTNVPLSLFLDFRLAGSQSQ